MTTDLRNSLFLNTKDSIDLGSSKISMLLKEDLENLGYKYIVQCLLIKKDEIEYRITMHLKSKDSDCYERIVFKGQSASYYDVYETVHADLMKEIDRCARAKKN